MVYNCITIYDKTFKLSVIKEFLMSEGIGYGEGDSSYQAAGKIEGITALVDAFYGYMHASQEYKVIRDMHPKDLKLSVQKLAYFLSGWLGGPKLYSQFFGSISIPQSHSHMNIGIKERDDWITCMQQAVDDQPYTPEFKIYLITQLNVPAERIRIACAK
jgi:hemoglobin